MSANIFSTRITRIKKIYADILFEESVLIYQIDVTHAPNKAMRKALLKLSEK